MCGQGQKARRRSNTKGARGRRPWARERYMLTKPREGGGSGAAVLEEHCRGEGKPGRSYCMSSTPLWSGWGRTTL